MSPRPTVPFTVHARLQQGAALDSRFGVALDGLLASRVRAEMTSALTSDGEALPGSLLDGGLALDRPVDQALPLQVCRRGQVWHWMGTTAQPVGHDGLPLVPCIDVHHVRVSADHRVAEAVALRLPPNLSSTSGRYRNRRMPVVTVPAAGLVWRGVGDPDMVRSLLNGLSTVGAHRGSGEGTVLNWTVTPEPGSAPDLSDRFGHLHADGTLGRPVPQACAARHGVAGAGEGMAGIRPPYWHPDRQHLLVLPGYRVAGASTPDPHGRAG